MSEVILNLKSDLKIPSDTEEIDCSEDNPEPKSSEKAECKFWNNVQVQVTLPLTNYIKLHNFIS